MCVSINKYVYINKTLTQEIHYTSHAIHPMKKQWKKEWKITDARYSASNMTKVVKTLQGIKYHIRAEVSDME